MCVFIYSMRLRETEREEGGEEGESVSSGDEEELLMSTALAAASVSKRPACFISADSHQQQTPHH